MDKQAMDNQSMDKQAVDKQAICGVVRKLQTRPGQPIGYALPLGEQLVAIDQYLHKRLTLKHSGNIYCIACGRKTRKSFAQGYCFVCFQNLAECDRCIVRPETCHHAEGTCRDEAWAATHCMQEHIVYLANSSGLKVGITRATQVPTRWYDQGASQALALFKVKNRYHSGLLEVVLKKYVSDRTDWRKMLKADAAPLDLPAAAKQLLEQAQADLDALKQRTPQLEWQQLAHSNNAVTQVAFPVVFYPHKINSLNFDKTPEIVGRLQGIKGQYLILDCGVVNIRKFGGYELHLSVDD